MSLNSFALFAVQLLRYPLAIAFALLLFASPALAQFRLGDPANPNAPPAAPQPNVRADLIADTAAIEPGKPFRLGVKFTIRPGWHIYYKEPGKTGYPTAVNWKLPEGFTTGTLQWPKPKAFDADPELLSYGYEGEVVLFSEVAPSGSLNDGEKLKLGASVEWLACKEDGECVPGDAEVALALPVGKAAPSADAALIEKYAALVPKATAATPAPPVERKPPSFSSIKLVQPGKPPSALWFLVLAFLGGIILNVMPCVLPVLSIKIMSFVRQSADDRKRIFRLGLVFAAGVVASFFALATVVILLKGAGSEVGWGFQLQEPRFVVIMSAVMTAFALSMFGVFEIEFPGSALQGASALQRKEGPAGAFFNGVLATALATPCTAPMLGPALGFAFTQPAWMIYLFFFAIAAGLSMPYVLLSAEPRWLKLLPKPGDWMETFKQFMGFLLLATVVWLLSVLGSQAGPEAIIWTLAFLTVVGFACWLFGIGFDLRAGRRKRALTTAVALLALLLGYFYFPEQHLRALAAEPATTTNGGSKTVGKIEWKPFSPELVEKLASEGKTVFVDFTADWCFTCKTNEKVVLAREDVQAAFIKHGVEALVADYTKKSPEITRILRQFGRAGVPMYLVFPAGRFDDPIQLPEVLTPSIVIDALEKASKPPAQNGGQ